MQIRRVKPKGFVIKRQVKRLASFFVFSTQYDSLGGTPTAVNLLSGGAIRHSGLSVHDNSQVTIDGSSIEFTLDTFGSSQVTVSQGMIGDSLRANNNSTATILGGEIGWNLKAQADSRISLYGGSIEHMLNAEDTSIITVYGSNFNYGLGEILDPTGTLTGILSNGDAINNDFYISTNASMVLVPEPATLLLLVFGAVMLRKRH
ncbi:MAG: PEP-CTERM sorting domain-containing protein [Planctomycetota bacterium]|jgi:hypothetical protein